MELLQPTRRQDWDLECRLSTVLHEEFQVTRRRTDLDRRIFEVVHVTQKVGPAGSTQSATQATSRLETKARSEGLTSVYR